jgi:hypothetical protein
VFHAATPRRLAVKSSPKATYIRSSLFAAGIRLADSTRASTGFGKEDEVNLKKPFGWNIARVEKMFRGMRVQDLTRLPRAHRPAAIMIAVIGVLAIAMLFAARQPAAHGTRQASHTVAAPAVAESSAPAAAVKATPAVTITGCLEQDDESFRLKDTEGADAPRSRSWKTGFLKKSSASIEVVDAANHLKLPKYVGQRVSVTGVLVDREMKARTLQRVATSCSDKPSRSEASE